MNNKLPYSPTISPEELDNFTPNVYLIGYSDDYELDLSIKNNPRMIDFHDWFDASEGEHAHIVIECMETKELVGQIVKEIPAVYKLYNGKAEPIFILSKRESWLKLSNFNLAADYYVNGINETSETLRRMTTETAPSNNAINGYCNNEKG